MGSVYISVLAVHWLFSFLCYRTIALRDFAFK